MKVKYSHAAYPPQGVEVGKVYDVKELKDLGLSMEQIKMLFSPLSGEWEVPKLTKKTEELKADKGE